MMYVAILNLIMSSTGGSSDPFTVSFMDPFSIILIAAIIWICTAFFSYTTYVGYSISRETDIDELLEKLPPEHDYSDEDSEY